MNFFDILKTKIMVHDSGSERKCTLADMETNKQHGGAHATKAPGLNLSLGVFRLVMARVFRLYKMHVCQNLRLHLH